MKIFQTQTVAQQKRRYFSKKGDFFQKIKVFIDKSEQKNVLFLVHIRASKRCSFAKTAFEGKIWCVGIDFA